MRRAIGAAILLLSLSLLIHDAGSGRLRTFRPFRDDRYDSQLGEAAREGDWARVRRLVRRGGDVNIAFALHCAASWRGDANVREAIVRFLIERGADVNAGAGRITALHHAAAAGNRDIAEFLVRRGADVDAKDLRNRTPLHFAAVGDRIGVAAFLVEEGASLGARDDVARTPLHNAAQCGSRHVAKLLIDEGANPNVKNSEGKTPLDLAARKRDRYLMLVKQDRLSKKEDAKYRAGLRKQETIVYLLRRHGGKTGKELDEEVKSQKSKVKTQNKR